MAFRYPSAKTLDPARAMRDVSIALRETMPQMDAAASEELRRLRARAYGPNADITQDRAALRRLRELEEHRAETASESPDADAPASTTDDVTPLELLFPDAGSVSANGVAADRIAADGELDADVPPSTEPAARASAARTRRRRRVLWTASVMASAALAASVTYALTGIVPVSASSGAAQIATLEPSAVVTVPAGWLGADDESQVFEFYGYTLFTGGEDYYPEPYSRCLFAVKTDQVPAGESFTSSSWTFEGRQYAGCGIGVFPAAVEVPFGDESPDELNAQFPSGIALQFVLDGDRVGVFLDSE